jgi:hypothetical protein
MRRKRLEAEKNPLSKKAPRSPVMTVSIKANPAQTRLTIPPTILPSPEFRLTCLCRKGEILLENFV